MSHDPTQGNEFDDVPGGLEDEPIGNVCNYGIIEIHPAGGGAPMVIDFEIMSARPLTQSQMEGHGQRIAATKVGSLAQYPDWARRFGQPLIQIFPTGHTFNC